MFVLRVRARGTPVEHLHADPGVYRATGGVSTKSSRSRMARVISRPRPRASTTSRGRPAPLGRGGAASGAARCAPSRPAHDLEVLDVGTQVALGRVRPSLALPSPPHAGQRRRAEELDDSRPQVVSGDSLGTRTSTSYSPPRTCDAADGSRATPRARRRSRKAIGQGLPGGEEPFAGHKLVEPDLDHVASQLEVGGRDGGQADASAWSPSGGVGDRQLGLGQHALELGDDVLLAQAESGIGAGVQDLPPLSRRVGLRSSSADGTAPRSRESRSARITPWSGSPTPAGLFVTFAIALVVVALWLARGPCRCSGSRSRSPSCSTRR